ncbi:hypothetical protein MIR68_002095 [Amoeboaphelidium protococcarum]|nr:hypothetical protein MIR68_002095 [Amoeboaphelidium protococcarum]
MGEGSMVIECIDNEGMRTSLMIQDVYSAPEVGFELDGEILMSSHQMSSGLYQLNVDTVTDQTLLQQDNLICLAASDFISTEHQLLLLHRRLGHPSLTMLKQMIQDGYFPDVDTSISRCVSVQCERVALALSIT